MEVSTLATFGELAKIGAFLAATGSASFAGWTVLKSIKEKKNAQLLSQAKLSLERGYETLCYNLNEGDFPPLDPTRWIVCARLLAEYSVTKATIKDSITLQECASHEEYWRLKFARRLDLIQSEPPSHFEPRPLKHTIPKIAVGIVHHFATKPDMEILKEITEMIDAPEDEQIDARWTHARKYIAST